MRRGPIRPTSERDICISLQDFVVLRDLDDHSLRETKFLGTEEGSNPILVVSFLLNSRRGASLAATCSTLSSLVFVVFELLRDESAPRRVKIKWDQVGTVKFAKRINFGAQQMYQIKVLLKKGC